MNKILLLGDSITEGFKTSDLLSDFDIINKGVSADSTTELIDRLNNHLVDGKFDLVFLLIGTNDIARNRKDEVILKNISKIIKEVKNYCSANGIFTTSILPTLNMDNRPNERIFHLNKKLETLSKELNVNYVNLHKFFIDSEGSLKKDFTEDGLHVNDTTYLEWASILRNILIQK
ncbi:MAG: GDSL-type esterase/lipase family protein [Ignavibacteriales bacterium]|nr:GDSL-type esterase/lipase family protein [Ignavibacteriales bacterium]